MRCRDKGTINDSQYYFFAPSEAFCRLNYALLVCGELFCTEEYHIQRTGGHAPLFVIMNQGCLALDYENKHHQANADDVLLIDGSKPHAYYALGSCSFFFMHFQGSSSLELTNTLIRENGSPVFKTRSHSALRQLFRPLLQRLHARQHMTAIETAPFVYTVLCTLQNHPCFSSPALSPAIIRSLDYIQEHVYETMTLQELARQANLSLYYFSHLFKNEIGTSPLEYVSLAKISLSRTLLKTTDKSISEIAALLDYSSASSFINAFSLRQGITPAKYRHHNRTS